jgi:hypothetical protein
MLDSMDGILTVERPNVREYRGEDVEWVQAKLDGWFVQVAQQRDPSVGLTVFGRKLEPRCELSHLLAGRRWYEQCESLLDPGSVLCGELHAPGQPASAVPTAMRAETMPLEFRPFAVPMWKGEDWSGRTDVNLLNELLEAMELSPPATCDADQFGSVGELDQWARYMGVEGVVLKESNYSGWYKRKLEATADLVVLAIKPGNGRFSGGCGSLICGLHDGTVVADVSGMDDATRETCDASAIGRVVEVRYQYVAAGGRLRHPRFMRWRDDKPREECDAI